MKGLEGRIERNVKGELDIAAERERQKWDDEGFGIDASELEELVSEAEEKAFYRAGRRIEKCLKRIGLLNFLDRCNRYKNERGMALRMLDEFSEKKGREFVYTAENKKGEIVQYEYAVILVNAHLYGRITEIYGKQFRCSRNYMQKFIAAFCKVGILKLLGRDGNRGYMYANGYYYPWRGDYVKQPFLKMEPEFIRFLEDFRLGV
jgi:hypothetical protein